MYHWYRQCGLEFSGGQGARHCIYLVTVTTAVCATSSPHVHNSSSFVATAAALSVPSTLPMIVTDRSMNVYELYMVVAYS